MTHIAKDFGGQPFLRDASCSSEEGSEGSPGVGCPKMGQSIEGRGRARFLAFVGILA